MRKISRPSKFLIAFLCWLAVVAASLAQGPPQMHPIAGENLAGSRVELPSAASGKVAVLVFGFTKASKAPTGEWAKKISGDFGHSSQFAVYRLPVLEDVPRLIRGMVIGSMRKGVAESERDHFIPILEGEADLKKLVGYREADDAYLVVLDRTGKIAKQMHGTMTDASYSELRREIAGLLKNAE